MDLPSFLIGLLPVIAVGFVSVVAFRRRHDRRHSSSPLIVNPYTLAVEPDADALGHPPVVQPAPPMTTSQTFDPQAAEIDAAARARPLAQPDVVLRPRADSPSPSGARASSSSDPG